MNIGTHLNINMDEKIKISLEIIKTFSKDFPFYTMVSTNFRPYSPVILHLCTSIYPNISVLWVDHGHNRPATYKYSEQIKSILNLNLKIYVPSVTSAYLKSLYGEIPSVENEKDLKFFTNILKLEPFRRGIRELSPKIWFTGLRKSQSDERSKLEVSSMDVNFKILKVNPILDWNDNDMELYMKKYNLPNEWDYYDPTKGNEKRECGLHSTWNI